MAANGRKFWLILNSFSHSEVVSITEIDANQKTYGIYPYCVPRRAWEYIMFFLSVFIFWEIPFEWLVTPTITQYHIVPAVIIDLFYFVDVYVVFHTGVLKHGVMKLDRKSILDEIPVWRRIVFAISPWPFYLIGYFLRIDSLYKFLLLFKLLRVVRLYDSYHTFRHTLVYISPISHMITKLFVFLTILHISACIFWFVGHNELPENSWLLLYDDLAQKPYTYQYAYSVLCMSTTMLTIGYGDLHPCTFHEVVIIIFVEAIGVLFYNFLISSLVSLVADPSRHSFLNRFNKAAASFKTRGASKSSMKELMKYYEYVWSHDRDRADFYALAADLPESLQKRIALALHSEVFNKMNALHGVGKPTLQKLAVLLSPQIFAPGDIIVKAGKVSNKMYFISEGKIEIRNTAGGLIHVLDGACVLGENSMLKKTKEQNSAFAQTYVSAFQLSREDFDEIVEVDPELHQTLVRNKMYY